MFKLGEGSTAILGHAVHGPTPIETNSILADSNTKLMFWDTLRERKSQLTDYTGFRLCSWTQLQSTLHQ